MNEQVLKNIFLYIPNMRKREGLQLCYFTYNNCTSKLVSAEDWLLHNQLSEAAQLQALESEVAHIVLINVQPPGRKATMSSGSLHHTGSSDASHLASPTLLCMQASGQVQLLSMPTTHIHTTQSLPYLHRPQMQKISIESYIDLMQLCTIIFR